MKEFPSSIYRIQLSRHFTIEQATKLLPYLNALGIDGVYCSPYFAANSDHGYDITDPRKLNPHVASATHFRAFCKKLHSLGMYHLMDLVPNHMAVKGANPWMVDIMKRGLKSRYAHFFDIDWKGGEGRLLLPLLGETFERACKEKHLVFVKRQGKLWVKYFDDYFPTREGSKTLEEQHYRLEHWLEASENINYRRFFNINELIGVRIEDPKVLKEHHSLVFELLKNGTVDGLRIDHPDGLYDPRTYFERLRKKHKGMIVVEKILEGEEELPLDWDVDGTVGYEFLSKMTGLFVDPKGEKALTNLYQSFSGEVRPFEEILFEKKKFYILTEMAADVKSLSERLFRALGKNRADLTQGDLMYGLLELLAAFPVYRTYITPKAVRVSPRDRNILEKAFREARIWGKEVPSAVYDLLERVFFLRIKSPSLRDFILRFQQLSAPIMAKGLEDITFYNYNRLLALNEVGGSPELFGTSVEDFHDFLSRKRKKWPGGLLPASTHDTKRSEEARLQLALLSEMPEEWAETVRRLSSIAKKHKTKGMPEANGEYLLYQTLLAVWPEKPSLDRLWTAYEKSIKEARFKTSWRHPNSRYEAAAKSFLSALLKDQTFIQTFELFQQKIERKGMLNALSATVLRLGAPGPVDIYQGTESWRFNLVDPDNRRPVDFASLQKLLTRVEKEPQLDDLSELKLYLHALLLNYRLAYKPLFLEGKYTPIPVQDPRVMAYRRSYRNQECIFIASRFFTRNSWRGEVKVGAGHFQDLLTGTIHHPKAGKLRLTALFSQLPFAVLFK
ncbi:MAG: Maltooligosyl trehalose synthase [Chlamydiae bacterium]|nr:Maltooligosyl trehalose synthase [Chlamydiota bacterium]